MTTVRGPRVAVGLGDAFHTEPDDREVREACTVAELALDEPPHAVELVEREWAVVAAALAGQILASPGDRQGVQPRAVPEMHVVHEADVLERLEVAVHGGDVRRGHATADPVGDLLSRHRPVRGEQRLQDEPAGC